MKQFLLAIAVVSAGITTGQENGTALFDESYVHEIRITFQQSDFWQQLKTDYENWFNNGTEIPYRMAEVSIDGTVISQAGVRQKGNFSNWAAGESLKKPLKISTSEFVAGQEYDGVRKINLANSFLDPSMMRDALAYKFLRNAGIAAPRTSYAKVYLNNTYWGLYTMVEEVDKRMLKNWYGGQNNDGNLFKCVNNTKLQYQGTNPEAYKDEFELKTNEEQNDWSRFVDLVEAIDKTGDEFETEVTEVLNVDKFLKVLAADVIMLNWDSYYYHGRNFYLYQNPETTKMDWIPWDYNLAFSTVNMDVIVNYSQLPPEDAKPLVQKVQQDNEMKNAYFQALCELVSDHFRSDQLDNYITTTGALIRPHLDADPNKFYTIANFDTSLVHNITTTDDLGEQTVRGLKQFISERNSEVAAQVLAHGFSCNSLSVNESEALSTKLYPNPFSEEFSIECQEVMDRIEIVSGQGQVLKAFNPQTTASTISLSDYAAGMYLVRVHAAGEVKTLSVVKQ